MTWCHGATTLTSSDRKAGSPMAALAQGPMLRMLSHTLGGGEGVEVTQGGVTETSPGGGRGGDNVGTRRGQRGDGPRRRRWPTGCPTAPRCRTPQSHPPRPGPLTSLLGGGDRGTGSPTPPNVTSPPITPHGDTTGSPPPPKCHLPPHCVTSPPPSVTSPFSGSPPPIIPPPITVTSPLTGSPPSP